MNKCSVCNHEEDNDQYELRPYGKNGALICFDCMKSSPEREAEAERQFSARLDVAAEETGIAVIGTKGGPQPYRGTK